MFTRKKDAPKRIFLAVYEVIFHEVAHVLERTGLYDALREAVFNYAIAKDGVESFNKRLKDLEALYKGMENTTPEAELAADLIGDYLFTDPDFVRKLSTEHRNIFEKIFDEIKYLCKVATAGTKEARQLEKVKKLFEEAYRTETKSPTAEGGARYSIRRDIVDVNGKEYDTVVELDKAVSKRVLSEPQRMLSYIKQNFVGLKIPVLDQSGNIEMIEFAGEKETTTKDGKRHKVLGELAFTTGDTRKLVIVNAQEVAEESVYDPKLSSTNNEHGWLDKNGWESRKTYVLAPDGNIYEAYLRIAKAKDGRNILYAVNLDINNGVAVDMGATQKRAAVLAATPSTGTVAQNKPGVNGKNSLSSENDIAPLPGGIYGKDVALEFPLPEGWENTDSRNNSGVDTARVSDYDNSEDAPVYEPYRPGQDIQQFDHTLWEERKAETAQEYGLSEVESESVDSYVGGSAYEWNAVLRGDENYEATAYYDYWIQQATAAFKKFPQFKGRTYRNLTFNSQDILNKFMAKHESGKTVTADSFLSSSKDPNGYVVSGDYVVHMVIDGISGRDISETYSIPGQQEVVYLPGTELYITGVKTANDGNPLIYVQEVRTNGKNMETDSDRNGQSSSGANYEGQAGNAERKGHDLGGIHSDRGVEGNGGAGDARQVQQPGSSPGYGRLDGDAEQGTKHSLSKQADELAPIGNSHTSDKNLISEAPTVEKTAGVFFGDIAPVREDLVTAASTAAKSQSIQETSADDIAPLPEGYKEQTTAEQDKVMEQKTEPHATRKELHQSIVDRVKAKFTEKGLDLDTVLKKAKNLSTFATVDNTPQRVMEKALGYKEGQLLSDLTVNQVAQNETEGIKWLNSFTDRKNGLLAKISKQYNIKLGVLFVHPAICL